MNANLRNVRPATPLPCLVIAGATTVDSVAVGGNIVASLPDLYDAEDSLLSRYPTGTLVVRASDRVALRVVMPRGWTPESQYLLNRALLLGKRRAA